MRGGEGDNLDDEINCLLAEYRSQPPDIRDVTMFDSILEVHDAMLLEMLIMS
jgi:hypothetical protein